MKKVSDDIKNYWNERANSYGLDPRSTTDDFWLRSVEGQKIIETLTIIGKKNNILDIGCGDGLNTLRISRRFPNSYVLGGDYSESMIRNARTLAHKTQLRNRPDFKSLDVCDLQSLRKQFDVVISDRCLINLPTRFLQKKAIQEIANSLRPSGYYIMVENFIEGHNEMNRLRRRVKLEEISVRWHNNYLDETFVNNIALKNFALVSRENISSIYYLITRVVYSKLCQLEKKEPDYDSKIYKIAADLFESTGNYGPINLLVFKKRRL